MRGARTEDNPAPHLLAALDQIRGVVVAQRRVADKSNEIPALPELLAPLDLDGALITADAMHTQVNTAEWIISRGAHYLLTVKDNQPGLHQTLKDLPWKDVPALSIPDGSHGRRVRRTLKAVQAPRWVDFPGAAQVIQIRRTRTIKGKKQVEVVHPVLLASHGSGPAPGRCGPDPRPSGHREPPPPGQGHGHGRGPPPTAHPQRTTDHGRPEKPGHPASSASSTDPTHPSPPPPEPWPHTPNEPSDYSPNHPPEPTLPTPCTEPPSRAPPMSLVGLLSRPGRSR